MNKYYILSIEHTGKHDHNLTFWRPDRCGYTWYIPAAGKYTLEEAKEICCNPGQEIAVPCEVVEAVAEKYKAVPKEKESVEWLNCKSNVWGHGVNEDRNN